MAKYDCQLPPYQWQPAQTAVNATHVPCSYDNYHLLRAHQSTATAADNTSIHHIHGNWQSQQPTATAAMETSIHQSQDSKHLEHLQQSASMAISTHNSYDICQPQQPAPTAAVKTCILKHQGKRLSTAPGQPAAAVTTGILNRHGKRHPPEPGQPALTSEWQPSSSVAVTTSYHHSHCTWQPGRPASTAAMAASTYNSQDDQHQPQ